MANNQDENDVYETIEFSDSSSNVYTEPVKNYGVLRRINIKTSPKQRQTAKKPPSGLKKSPRGLQKCNAMLDISRSMEEQEEPAVELRVKPYETSEISRPDNRVIAVGLHNKNITIRSESNRTLLFRISKRNLLTAKICRHLSNHEMFRVS